jgi:hypothetical protein
MQRRRTMAKLGIVVAGLLWCVCTVRAFAPGTSSAHRDRVCVVYVCACCVWLSLFLSLSLSLSLAAVRCNGWGSRVVPRRKHAVSARDSHHHHPCLPNPNPPCPIPTGVSCTRCDHPARSLVLAEILESQCPSLIFTY